jgi:hypothetical protein
MSRPRLRHVVAVTVLAFAAGCAGPTTPGQAAPRLSEVLSRVDDAIAQHHYRQARNELDNLVSAVDDARNAGDLNAEQANGVLAASARLSAALPKPTRQPKPEPTPSPAETGSDGEHHGEGWGKHRKHLSEWLKKHQDQQGGGGDGDED